jgi:hypothetical protein
MTLRGSSAGRTCSELQQSCNSCNRAATERAQQAGLARADMYSHAGGILALQCLQQSCNGACVWGQRDTTCACSAYARAHVVYAHMHYMCIHYVCIRARVCTTCIHYMCIRVRVSTTCAYTKCAYARAYALFAYTKCAYARAIVLCLCLSLLSQ